MAFQPAIIIIVVILNTQMVIKKEYRELFTSESKFKCL